MKLHLPLSLRSALLAVLTAFPLAYAVEEETGQNTRIIEGEQTLEEQTFEDLNLIVKKGGKLTIADYSTQLTGTSIISVYGELELNRGYIARASRENSKASAEIMVTGENSTFDMSRGYIAYAREANSEASAKITVEDGGTFTMSSVYTYVSTGYIAYTSGETNEASAEIMVTGENSTFDISDGYIAEAFGKNSKASAKITVEDGGTFDMSRAHIAYASRENSKASAEISVENGGTFTMSGGYIAETYGATSKVSAEISVTGENSTFTISGRAYIAYALGENSKASAKITVEDGGTFTMSSSSAYIAWATEASNEASAKITVEDGGTFTMSSGHIAYASVALNEASAEIMVRKGGIFTMNSSDAYIASTWDELATATADITVVGTFDYKGGLFGSGAQFYIEDDGVLNMNDESMESGIYNAPKITMRGGKLVGADNYSGNLIIDVESGFAGTSVDLGGVDAARITSVKVAQPGVQITGLMAGSTLTISGAENLLAVGMGNTNLAGGSGQAIIVFNDNDGIVSFDSEGATLSLMLDIKANVLTALREENSTFTITLTNGDVSNWDAANFTFRGVVQYLGFEVQEVEDGTLVIQAGDMDNLYIASRDGETATPDAVEGKDAVIVDVDLTVDAGEDGVTMNHVDSLGEDADLTVKGNSGEDINAEFHNEKEVDTELGGDLTITNEGAGKANMDKTGEGRFTVGGNLNVDGDLNVQEGGLTLDGEDNRVGGDVTVGKKDGTEGNLEVNGKLTVEGALDLEDGNGSITGDGELDVEGSLKLGDNVELNGPSVNLDENGELDMNGKDASLGGLSGDGTVNGDTDGNSHLDIEGKGGDFSGEFTGNGSITVTGDETHQSFTDTECKDEPGWDLEVQDGGHLSLTESTFHDVEAKKDGNLEFRAKGTGAADNGGANVTLTGNLIFRNGSTTTLTFNMNADKLWSENKAMMVTVTGTIYIEREANFLLDALEGTLPNKKAGDLRDVQVMSGSEIKVADEFGEDILDIAPAAETATGNSESLNVELTGLMYLYYENPTLIVRDAGVFVSADKRAEDDSPLQDAAKGASGTAQVGADLLDHADLPSDPTLHEVGEELGDRLAAGDKAGAAKLMAAVAGSTVTSLGAAQRDATRGELQRAMGYASMKYAPRTESVNNTVSLGKTSGSASSSLPSRSKMPIHMWIEGSGTFNKLSQDGDLSGYRLNSWGGTLGAAMAVSKNTLVGLALSAQYGDLEATAADTAKGDLDGYYLSLFARVQGAKWGHSFVVTLGKHDATLNRTVDYTRGSYTGRGETDGTAFAAAYELSYDIALAEDGSSVLQPMVSARIMSTNMSGYSESGADGAGLDVGDQKWTTSTVALGLRWLTRVDDSIFGGTAYTELRAGVAQDFGDTQGSADVALLANPTYRRTVQGAEVERTSFQLGAGVALPVSADTAIYMNANADLRSGSTNWGASAGVRLSF